MVPNVRRIKRRCFACCGTVLHDCDYQGPCHWSRSWPRGSSKRMHLVLYSSQMNEAPFHHWSNRAMHMCRRGTSTCWTCRLLHNCANSTAMWSYMMVVNVLMREVILMLIGKETLLVVEIVVVVLQLGQLRPSCAAGVVTLQGINVAWCHAWRSAYVIVATAWSDVCARLPDWPCSEWAVGHSGLSCWGRCDQVATDSSAPKKSRRWSEEYRNALLNRGLEMTNLLKK